MVNFVGGRILTVGPFLFDHHSTTLLEAKGVIFKNRGVNSFLSYFSRDFPAAVEIVEMTLQRRENTS